MSPAEIKLYSPEPGYPGVELTVTSTSKGIWLERGNSLVSLPPTILKTVEMNGS